MTPRLTGTPGDDVVACPECDVAGRVYERTHSTRDYHKPFKCHNCKTEFTEPNRRPPKPSAVGTDDPPSNEDEDGLPPSLGEDAKEMIRNIRGP